MRRRFAKVLAIDPETWRADLLALILRASLLLSLVVYPPSLYMVIKSGYVGVAIIDTLAVMAIFSLFYFDRLPFRWRAAPFCLICYALGTALMISVGSVSQIYLFGFSIVTTLLLGLRMGLWSVALSSATMLVIGYFGYAAAEMASARWSHGYAEWTVVTINFGVMDAVLTLAIGAVLASVENALARERAARASFERERGLLRTLVDALPDVVFTKDAYGRFVVSNPATLARYGFNRESDLAGKTVFDIMPRALAESFHVDDLEVLAGRPILNREESNDHTNGTPRMYLTIKVPLRDPAGHIVGLVGISRDITERKRAAEERERLLAHLRLQIERMPLAYLLTDADVRYIRWNPAANRMFGFTEAEVLGKHPFEVIVPEEAQPLVAGIFERLKKGDMDAHGQCDNRTKSGATITCEWFNTPLFDSDGAFAGMLSLAQDISERKKLEEQLRQSQKMEAIGQLAGGVAHDFNNLLTVISGYSELLLLAPEASSSMKQSLKAICDAVDRAAGLTRQLLAFSRRTMLQPKVLDLNAVVNETSRMLRRLIGEDILFTTALGPNLGRVKVDPGQLDQILINLAVNARDAMPKGGRLTIETANVELSQEYVASRLDCKAGPHVMLAMTDTGCGMTPEVMARIFEPFYTTKGVGKGTGLGLAMIFGIVQQSDGCIHVYSEPGHGSTFKIYFPAVAEPLSRKDDLAATAGQGGTETILLVEDEENVRCLALTSLRMHGYNVLTATDGSDALRIAQSHGGTVHMLLTDVVMPNISGPALAKALQARFPALKVLFMSGYTDDAVVRHGLLQADVAFIQKPYTPRTLAQKVRQVLDENSTSTR